MTKRRTGPKPLCLTCRVRRVNEWANRFCSQACVPYETRAASCRKSRKTFAYRRRAVFFADVFARMTEGRTRVTKEAVLDALMEAYTRGYGNGYHKAVAGLRVSARKVA